MRAIPERLTLGEWALRVFTALLIGALMLALWNLRDVFMLIFLALLVAMIMQIPVRALERIGVNRALSIALSAITVITVLMLLFVLIVPVFVTQIARLATDLPEFLNRAQIEYDALADRYRSLPHLTFGEITQGDVSEFASDQAGAISQRVFPFLSGLGGTLTSIVFMFFIAVFFVTSPFDYVEGMLTLVPPDYRPRAFEITQKLGHRLRRWFVGQTINMLTSGIIITFVTGVILGLPNAAALGVLAGVMEFVPNIGALIAMVPALIIALAEDPVLVPFTLLAYIIAQQIQSNIIMPRIMARQTSVPAATILIAQIIGASLFGFLGVLLALPLTIVIMILVEEIYVYDILNSRRARLTTQIRPDGMQYTTVTSAVYRPRYLSPGEAARLQAQGEDLFAREANEIVEIITPHSPALEQAVRGQSAVWLAILMLTVAQGMALIRSLFKSE